MMVFSDHEQREAGMCDLWHGWPASSSPWVLKSASYIVPKVPWYPGASYSQVLKGTNDMYPLLAAPKIPRCPDASYPQELKSANPLLP